MPRLCGSAPCTRTCHSQWLPAFAPHLTPPQCLPLCQRCSRGTRGLLPASWHAGNVNTPLLRQRLSSRGIGTGFASGRSFSLLAPTVGSRRTSFRTRKPRRCAALFTFGFRWLAPSAPDACTADALAQAAWRTDLTLQMPTELYQPTLTELSISLQHCRRPILGDTDSFRDSSPERSTSSVERLTFGSPAIPEMHIDRRLSAPTLEELQQILQQVQTAPSQGGRVPP